MHLGRSIQNIPPGKSQPISRVVAFFRPFKNGPIPSSHESKLVLARAQRLLEPALRMGHNAALGLDSLIPLRMPEEDRFRECPAELPF